MLVLRTLSLQLREVDSNAKVQNSEFSIMVAQDRPFSKPYDKPTVYKTLEQLIQTVNSLDTKVASVECSVKTSMRNLNFPQITRSGGGDASTSIVRARTCQVSSHY